MTFSFGVGLALTALILLVQHWLPWKRNLGPLIRYVMGSCAVLAGVCVWMGECGMWSMFLQLCAFYAVAGMAVGAAYLHDRGRNTEQRLRVYECDGD